MPHIYEVFVQVLLASLSLSAPAAQFGKCSVVFCVGLGCSRNKIRRVFNRVFISSLIDTVVKLRDDN